MRKMQKKQVTDLVKLLEKVHAEIRKAVDANNSAIAMSLLEQCQNAAITIGEMIEKTEGEGFVTISILEEYCELVYQIHEEIAQNRQVNPNEAERTLGEILLHIEDSIDKDIKIRSEVVFLPYKASAWDSLESVWRAAEEDPDCDVYVIPIPYYDKNPDRSLREMHYEGEQYPEEVPITRYDEFDFGQHQPDMIYIHNPYDEYNHAISVHPFFYSTNLKKFTENLIYIPYFVLDEIAPDDERAVCSMEHFVAMPGVVNADKVIVQSESMRRSYIDYLTKAAGEHTREVWEEKIVGWGSPRMDKDLKVKKELQIPEEWLKVIQKPDGSRKKVILYHTNIGTMLQYGEQMLQKLQNVLEIFKENQDEVALLWNPLLFQATIECLPQQMWTEYLQLVEEYKAEGWGIYDDAADGEQRAFLCDAYYGDGSSMAQLFLGTGKPVMIQDIGII